jgi:hypothetical protein
MELANRVELESKFSAKLARLYGSHRRKIAAAIKATGDPVDPTKVPVSLWREIEEEIKRQLEEEILLIYLLAIAISSKEIGMNVSLSSMRKLGSAYASVRAADMAQKMTNHSRERIAAGSIPLEVFSPERAARVAQTEISYAQTEATLDSARSPEAKQDQKAAEKEEQEAEKQSGKKAGKNRIEKGDATGDDQDDIPSDKPKSGEGGKKDGQKKQRLTLVAYWRHSHIRGKGHAGAAEKPCPICTPRLNKPESQWGGLIPGQSHPNCDCYIEFVALNDNTPQPSAN